MIKNRIVFFEQQLLELQELYNSQQQLTVQLSDKLEKTEVCLPFRIQYATIVYFTIME